MSSVTVAGADKTGVTLSFDSAANAALAHQLAAAITVGVQANTILPADSKDGPPPTLSGGATGEYVQSTNNGLTSLPGGYKAVVVSGNNAVVFGSGDDGESVLASNGGIRFFASTGSGTVVAGGGDNSITVLPSDQGDWSINTGNGNDAILALGAGTDLINAGGGANKIQLGNGSYLLQSSGDDTVIAGAGQETIAAFGTGHNLVIGNASNLVFIADQGSSTIMGGTGSDTFFGFLSKGPDLVYGGTAGNNLLYAGDGQTTLFGGGDGDQLYASGSQKQELHAGKGNETLSGGFASGNDTFYGGSGANQISGGLGNNTFVAGTGSATVTAGFGTDRFLFNNGQAGGSELIQSFTQGDDRIDLEGYGRNQVNQALRQQQTTDGNTTITLSDNTTVTFANVTSLTADDFATSGGGRDDGGVGYNHGHGGHEYNLGGRGLGNSDQDNHDHVGGSPRPDIA